MVAGGAVPNAVRGIRVGGALMGAVNMAIPAGYFINGHHDKTLMLIVWFLAGAWIAIRPWSLGVFIDPNGFTVKSWLRNYHFSHGSVESVDMVPVYSGVLLAAAVGYIPFIGSVRMLEIVTTDDKRIWLPCTIGRRNTVLRLARLLRVQVGLSSAHSTFSD